MSSVQEIVSMFLLRIFVGAIGAFAIVVLVVCAIGLVADPQSGIVTIGYLLQASIVCLLVALWRLLDARLPDIRTFAGPADPKVVARPSVPVPPGAVPPLPPAPRK